MEKVLLVTGASSDVGAALIRQVSGEYSLIYAQYCHMSEAFQALLNEVSAKTRVIPLQADFSRQESVEELIRTVQAEGTLPDHIVHLPAPKAFNKQFHKDSWDHFSLGWEVCVHSAVSILKAFLPPMAKKHSGRVVFMLTGYTEGKPPKFQSCYVTVKYALLGLMKSLSAEYADKGITVNGVSPGMMETKFLSEIPELIVRQNAAGTPTGRNVTVDEVVPVIAYMLSDAGASMTGQNIVLTGGA